MKEQIIARFPQLLPRAIAWAERESQLVRAAGTPPPPPLEELAQKVGVAEPSHIRLVAVDAFHEPEDVELRGAADYLGMFGPGMNGLTLGYAVILRKGHQFDGSLLAHEFRHVAQYESCGSIAAFLSVHLRQLLAFGYEDSPFEVDARAHEHHAA